MPSGRTDQGRLSKPEDVINSKKYIASSCICALYKSSSDVVVSIKKPNPSTNKKTEDKKHLLLYTTEQSFQKAEHAFKREKIIPVAFGMNRKNVKLFPILLLES